MTVAYSAGDDARIIRPARRVVDEGLGSPILIGSIGEIQRSAELATTPSTGRDVLDPGSRARQRRYARPLWPIAPQGDDGSSGRTKTA